MTHNDDTLQRAVASDWRRHFDRKRLFIDDLPLWVANLIAAERTSEYMVGSLVSLGKSRSYAERLVEAARHQALSERVIRSIYSKIRDGMTEAEASAAVEREIEEAKAKMADIAAQDDRISAATQNITFRQIGAPAPDWPGLKEPLQSAWVDPIEIPESTDPIVAVGVPVAAFVVVTLISVAILVAVFR